MEKAKLKWTIVLLPIFIVGLLLVMQSIKALARYDTTLLTFTGQVTLEDNQAIRNAVGKDTEFALFTRSENAYISNRWMRGTPVSVYTCSEKYFELAGLPRINGRFLWDTDVQKRNRCAVIDENLAVLLFAGKDCIGESVTIFGAAYTVIGICGAEDGILTSVDENAVYLPMGTYASPITQSGCLLRAQNDLALTFSLQKNIPAIAGIRSINHLKMRAAMWSNIPHMALDVIFIMTLVTAIRIIIHYLKLYIGCIREELKNTYLMQYLKDHLYWIALHIAVIGVLCTLFILWDRAVRFQIVMDADMIPPNLIDLKGWMDNLTAYMRDRNAMSGIAFSQSFQISVYGWISVAASAFTISAAVKLLHDARVWLAGLCSYVLIGNGSGLARFLIRRRA